MRGSSVTDIEARIASFGDLWPQRSPERWIRAVAEEAGEVVGAFNKWHDGNKIKPKNREDVLEELAQLMGVVYMTAHQLGLSYQEFLESVDGFLAAKEDQIRRVRAGEWPVEPILPKPHTELISDEEHEAAAELQERRWNYRVG